ncbi:MAG: translation initiation factor IF-2 [archaeon]
MARIRQPIVTVAGHVDHGKTSILDRIRGTSIQEGEAGGITQKISFTTMPKDVIIKRAEVILEKFNIPLEIPGFLFIDTPGHAAFTNLRKRGGSLADIAVLVIDINEGVKPQTAEVLQILKANKTPFIIALNKIDNISGWKRAESGFVFDSLNMQAINVHQNYEEKFYTLIGALNAYKIDAEVYTKIKDFTKQVAIVPCSARSGEGINEIIAMLCALSQKFLKERISIADDAVGKGVILEIKKEKTINYMESILYDGVLKENDEIAIASFDDVITTKIRNIQQALPLNKGYKTEKEVEAASGMKLQIINKDNQDILPGMPFQVFKNEKELQEIKKQFKKEISQEIQTDGEGIIAKADSLGSLEALLVLLKQKQIRVFKAGIGPITKKDVYIANSLENENKVILGFNVQLADDIKEETKEKELKDVLILTNEVVYRIIEDYEEYREKKQMEIERKKLQELPSLVKIKILDFVFRNSNPAIFGVVVEGGILKHDINLINKKDEKVGHVKAIQHEKENVQKAEQGQEVAISIPGVNFERQLEVGEHLFSNLAESQFRKFKDNKDLLTEAEKKVLMDIAEIKRKTNNVWGV